jgi:predicted amidohydrolase
MSTLTVTGIQSDLHWEDRKANLQVFEEKIFSISQPTEIVVLPEMFSTGFSMQPETLAETMEGETVHWMKRVAAKKKIILTGSLIIKDSSPPLAKETGLASPAASLRRPRGSEAYYNRLVWVLPNGQVGHYDKRHLFAYGDEDQHYTPGEKRLIASVKGWKINLLVCYDLRFPVWSRQSPSPSRQVGAEPEYDVLIYVANWPEKRIHAWTTLLRARAIENQCYVFGVNRTGDDGKKIHYTGESMAVDPMGEILYHKKEEEDIFTITLDKSHLEKAREKFPFWRDADIFKIITNSE